jgi:hypothetical protein
MTIKFTLNGTETQEDLEAIAYTEDFTNQMLDNDPDCFNGMTEEQIWDEAQEAFWYAWECDQ